MLNKKIEDLLNLQVTREAYSSNLYLAMASYMEVEGYAGISKWMYAQSDEERMHMLKFIAYINDRNGKAVIDTVDQPPVQFGSIKETFEAVLEHEQKISAWINDIVAATFEEKDFTTYNWLQWFVTEQIEEEASVKEILDKLTMLNGENMYLFDRDVLGMRGAADTTAAE